MRRGVGTVVLAAATLFAALSSAPAFADDGTSDPRDARGRVDIRQVSHFKHKDFVTYRVETYAGFDDTKDFYQMRWDFDLDGDGRANDGCVLLEQVGDGRLRATLYPDCGKESWSTAEVSKPASNVVKFSLQTSDLVYGASFRPGQSVRYRVTAQDLDGNKDTAPNDGLITQVGVAKPPPQPRDGSVMPVGRPANANPGYVSTEGAPVGDSNSTGQGGPSQPAAAGKAAAPVGLILVGVIGGALVGALIVFAFRRRAPAYVYASEATPDVPQQSTFVDVTPSPVAVVEAPPPVPAPDLEPARASSFGFADWEHFASAPADELELDRELGLVPKRSSNGTAVHAPDT